MSDSGNSGSNGDTLTDLNSSLEKLLKTNPTLANVEIVFASPTGTWSEQVNKPTVNFFLYDLRENRERREQYWCEPDRDDLGRAKQRRRPPVCMTLSYMITVWTTEPELPHRILWAVLETLFRNSPLPETVLAESLKPMHPIMTEVAQPDGVLKNVSEFWGALGNQIRPTINLVVTLDLDLAQEQPDLQLPTKGSVLDLRQLGVHRVLVRNGQQQPIRGAKVSLLGTGVDGQSIQLQATPLTDPLQGYVFDAVVPGHYRCHVEVEGRPSYEEDVIIPARDWMTVSLP